jgi:hypothetical protein
MLEALPISAPFHASNYMGKIVANGKRQRRNAMLTTIARPLPAVSVYFE